MSGKIRNSFTQTEEAQEYEEDDMVLQSRDMNIPKPSA